MRGDDGVLRAGRGQGSVSVGRGRGEAGRGRGTPPQSWGAMRRSHHQGRRAGRRRAARGAAPRGVALRARVRHAGAAHGGCVSGVSRGVNAEHAERISRHIHQYGRMFRREMGDLTRFLDILLIFLRSSLIIFSSLHMRVCRGKGRKLPFGSGAVARRRAARARRRGSPASPLSRLWHRMRPSVALCRRHRVTSARRPAAPPARLLEVFIY